MLKKQSLFLSMLLLVVIFYPQISPAELDRSLGIDELIQSPQINRVFPSGDDTEHIMLINWNGDNSTVIFISNSMLANDIDGLYSSMVTVAYSSDGQYITYLNKEITPNTPICRLQTGIFDLNLLYFSSSDNAIVGFGWEYSEWNSSSVSTEQHAEYTIYNRENGDTVFINVLNSSSGMSFSSSFRQSNPDIEANRSHPVTPNGANGQRTYINYRLSILHHMDEQKLLYCQIINGANVAYRDIGVFVSIQEIKYVNPNNNTDLKSTSLNWRGPNCQNSSPLMNDIYQYQTMIGESYNQYRPHTDTTIYMYYDDTSNHDGLNWNNTGLGCAWNRYYDQQNNNNGSNGIGAGWIKIDESLNVKQVFIEYHSSLIAHELGHILGAKHSNAIYSNNRNCLNRWDTTGNSSHNSVIKSGLFDTISCFSLPYFSNASSLRMQYGAIPGLPYEIHIPITNQFSRLFTTSEGIYIFSVESSRKHIHNHDVDAGDPFWKVQFIFSTNNASILSSNCEYGVIATTTNIINTNIVTDWNGISMRYCTMSIYGSGKYESYYQQYNNLINISDWNGNGVVDDNRQHIVCTPLTPPCVFELKPNIMISGVQYPVHQDWVVRWSQIN